MVKFDDVPASSASDRRYVYDGLGRRVRKSTALTGNGVDTLYIYDAFGNLGAEYSETGSLPVGIHFPTTDHLGSSRIVTDYASGVASRHDYYPFGAEIPAGIGSRPVEESYGEPGLNQKFTGKERDTESGMDYFGGRYFSGAQGMFVSSDRPLIDQDPGDHRTWNLNAYGRNNLLSFVDIQGN